MQVKGNPCLLKTRFAHISVSFVAELRPPLIKGLQMLAKFSVGRTPCMREGVFNSVI